MEIVIANKSHSIYADIICETIADAAQVRGTGIAKRKPEYIITKMENGNAVIALDGDKFAGFCYIEQWSHGKFVANSGLIVHPDFRNQGLAKEIKKKIFEHSRTKFPEAKVFSITTGLAVMKMNSDLGYKPVTFSELTDDQSFWNGCQTCKNYDVLQRTEQKMCLCTGMLYDASKKNETAKTHEHSYDKKVWTRLKNIKQSIFLKKEKNGKENKSDNSFPLGKMSKSDRKGKLVIAYSGGLDTSYCAVSLSKAGYDVHAVSVNTGGFTDEEIFEIEKNAYKMGVSTYKNIDAISSYYNKVIKYLIFGNVLKNNTYPLSVSAERIIQAIEIVEYAKSIEAKYIAHGSTGAGNDQVRFDMIFQILAPDIEIITPIRDGKLTRQQEIDYLIENGVDRSWEKAKYSVNKGLWGTSVGGEETLTSNKPLPDSAYPSQLIQSEEKKVTLTFLKGELVAVNGIKNNPEINIEVLNNLASAFAIGRDIHVGDTIVGIKGRVGFEAAAALITIKAHHLLEKHTLTKWQLQHKDYMASFYGMHLHEGQYLDPVMRDMEAFLQSSQDKVSGDVFLTLKPYHFSLDGITSKHDLMHAKFGSYGEENKGWTAEEAKGFIKILGNQNKIYQQVNS